MFIISNATGRQLYMPRTLHPTRHTQPHPMINYPVNNAELCLLHHVEEFLIEVETGLTYCGQKAEEEMRLIVHDCRMYIVPESEGRTHNNHFNAQQGVFIYQQLLFFG